LVSVDQEQRRHSLELEGLDCKPASVLHMPVDELEPMVEGHSASHLSKTSWRDLHDFAGAELDLKIPMTLTLTWSSKFFFQPRSH
jgi:hypothetical protein